MKVVVVVLLLCCWDSAQGEQGKVTPITCMFGPQPHLL